MLHEAVAGTTRAIVSGRERLRSAPETLAAVTALESPAKARPRITITYCTLCQWLLRSAWLAQELLQTFGQDLGEVALVPGTAGNFQVAYEGEVIWDRKTDGGFPEAKVLKQRVRDRLDPDRDLGHSDVPKDPPFED